LKTTIVPAQITTVEDKITGNLTLPQLLLLCVPLFLGCAIYCIFPPFLHVAPYKVVVLVALLVSGCTLAIRVKSKLMLEWFTMLARYAYRPRFYVFDHSCLWGRVGENNNVATNVSSQVKVKPLLGAIRHIADISIEDTVLLETMLSRERTDIMFKASKHGELYVSVAQRD
jgi:hypothetical protein